MPNLDSKYVVEILDDTGNLVSELTGRAIKREFTVRRNRAEQIILQFDLDTIEQFLRDSKTNIEEVFAVGKNEVRIKRGDRFLVGGQISHVEGAISQRSKTLTVRAVGFLDLFKDRYTAASKVFTGIDAGQIAKTLIDDSQALTNGNFGITVGTIETSVNRTRTYEYKNIKDAIIQLSEAINGFDFEFTHDKIFKVYYPRIGADNLELQFEYPRNIKSISLPINGLNLANEVTVRGQGFGNSQLVEVRSDIDSQLSFKLRQNILDLPDVKEATTLQEHGDEEKRLFAYPLQIPIVVIDGNQSPSIGSYWIGDIIKVSVLETSFFKGMNNTFRIDELNVKIDSNDSEVIILGLT